MEVAGKIVVVTGAGSGIGRALACRFVEEGATVVCVDVDEATAASTAGEFGGLSSRTDVSSGEQMTAMIDQVETEVGPIDLFCSNAGIARGRDLDAPLDEWQRSWEVNVMAHVHAARALVPRMVERGGGYFLITASAAGLLNQIGGAAYGVTKHAAVGFGEWLAITYGHRGIGVSMLCPQAVRTAMTSASNASTRAAAGDGMMEPDEVAESVIEGLRNEHFLILPHPEVLEYMRRKTSDYDRWIAGMNRWMQSLEE